ncbi:DUF1287 domain-containing protein [Acinetobacter sp. ULE_I010]|uniref:DUF1287 domain-containing protein n=1 Tax=Acinetobacter sp. ULE_I010 TaxID=3373065 RepID=UPI003AF9D81E
MRIKFFHIFTILFFSIISFEISAFQNNKLVTDARSQIWKTLYYDPSYTQLKYPMGDVPIVKGVCTDVVVRALRHQDIDLQQRIHEDMKANFKKYPQKWGLKGTDKNIDHRRVPNIMTYFQRQGYYVNDQKYRAGDIVAWDLGKGLTHIGIISDKTTMMTNTPLVIHNIGYGARENDILYEYKIIGHYRLPNALK